MPYRNGGSLRSTDLWTSHVDAQTLIEIGQDRRGPCLSMYLPILGAADGSDAREMSALIEKARTLLRESSVPARTATAVLHPTRSVVDARQVWQSGSKGIAVFTSTAMFAVVLTGVQVLSQLVIARRFVTRQLVPALEGLTEFEVRSALKGLGTTPRDERLVAEVGAVLSAANAGRIAELYVDRSAQAWGRFDRLTGRVRRLEAMGPDADDLIDLAAVTTIAHGGRVHVTDRLESGGRRVPLLAQVSGTRSMKATA